MSILSSQNIENDFKQDENKESEPVIEINNIENLRNRKDYHKQYYKDNKNKILEQVKQNKKYNIRYVRELNQGYILFKNIRPSTIEKYKIICDTVTNKYKSDL